MTGLVRTVSLAFGIFATGLLATQVASAQEARSALVTLLSSNSIDQSLFPDNFFQQFPVAPLQQLLDQLRSQAGSFRSVRREGGAYIGDYDNGSVPFEIFVDSRGRILAIYALGFVPKSTAMPTGLNDDIEVGHVLAKIFQDPSVDLSLFEDAALAAKVANNRDVIVAGLGTFNGVFFSHGSYFARFDTMQLPIFTYVTQAKKIRSIWIYPPVPIKAVMGP